MNFKQQYGMTVKDLGWLVLILIIYSCVSFFNLGVRQAPQSFWTVINGQNEAILKLEQKSEVAKLRYFTGPRAGKINLSISDDGATYRPLVILEEPKVFAWFDLPLNSNFLYLKLEALEEASLGEVGLYDLNGNLIKTEAITEGAKVLVDEAQVIPETISFLNSMYFDEIYHGRTAYEYLHGLEIYEWTHPPLGKLIISLGTWLWGMTPFAYRVFGNVAGILMVGLMYLLGKKMFGKTCYAITAAVLLSVDGMHFVQTRLATVDSFLVLFILLAYLFMYSYIECKNESALSLKLIYLFLSGFFMGAAIATKWNGAYAAIGLAIIFFWNYVGRKGQTGRRIWEEQKEKLILACCLFFIALPIVIYIGSYIPFFLSGHSLKELAALQLKMYHYHADLESTHPFASKWYKWPLGIKPVWYYQGQVPEGVFASIAAHSNPFIWWTGIVAMIYIFIEAIVENDSLSFFLIIAILGLYLPNALTPRIMFLYHYFPVVPFMILAIVKMLKNFAERTKRYELLRWYSLIAIGFFVFFYPIYSGLMMPRWYGNMVEWLPSWQFFI